MSDPKLSRAQKTFLATLDPTPGRWSEVFPSEHKTASCLERRGIIEIRRPENPYNYWEARMKPQTGV